MFHLDNSSDIYSRYHFLQVIVYGAQTNMWDYPVVSNDTWNLKLNNVMSCAVIGTVLTIKVFTYKSHVPDCQTVMLLFCINFDILINMDYCMEPLFICC